MMKDPQSFAGLICFLDVVANPELLDEFTILVDVLVLDVLQKAAPLADELHESTTRVVVLLVNLQMLGQVADASAQDGNLDLCASGVPLAFAELLDELCHFFLGDAVFVSHASTFLRITAWSLQDRAIKQVVHES